MVALGLSFFRNTGGRNNRGRITVRHRGRRAYLRRLLPYPSFLPHTRTRRYRPLGGQGLIVAAKIAPKRYSVARFPYRFRREPFTFTLGTFRPGASTARLYTVPPGSFVTFVQLAHSGRPVFGRAPGSKVQVLRRRGSYTTVRLPSGELRRLHAKLFSFASTEEEETFELPVFYKAGQVRQLGYRPHVRGCAMNPVDHPHGGRTGESRPSVTPWGVLTKGHRTRTRPVNPKVVLRTVQQFKAAQR
jgi:large subunit ribosomal protein L2